MNPATVSNIQALVHLAGWRPGTAADRTDSLPPMTDPATWRPPADAHVDRPADDRVAELLAGVVTALCARMDQATEVPTGSGPTGPALLLCAAHRPGAPTHVLADAVGLSRSGAVRALDRLESSGLVLRRDGPDHRSSLVLLTSAGEIAAQQIFAARRDAVADVIADLPGEAAAALLPVLEALAVTLSVRLPGRRQ